MTLIGHSGILGVKSRLKGCSYKRRDIKRAYQKRAERHNRGKRETARNAHTYDKRDVVCGIWEQWVKLFDRRIYQSYK